MTNYSTDGDLVYLRPNILNNGQADFAWAHNQAYEIINRTIEAEWWISVAPLHNINTAETAFDITKLDATQLKTLSVYKALSLIYTSLAKDIPTEDGPYQWHAHFREQYDEELSRLMKTGFNYDWEADGITAIDKFQPSTRRLLRM